MPHGIQTERDVRVRWVVRDGWAPQFSMPGVWGWDEVIPDVARTLATAAVGRVGVSSESVRNSHRPRAY